MGYREMEKELQKTCLTFLRYNMWDSILST